MVKDNSTSTTVAMDLDTKKKEVGKSWGNRRWGGGWRRGGWGRRRWNNPWKPKTPLQKLQAICQQHTLLPTISVEEQNEDKGLKVVIEIDISKLEGKEEGETTLRQTTWGTSLDEAKQEAVSQLLKHEKIAPHVPAAEQAAQGSDNTWTGTWIAQKDFKEDANKAEMLFERYCEENSLTLEYKETGEYPRVLVECIINGQVVAKGKGKGPWGAKKWAMQEAYFWCRKNVKDNHVEWNKARGQKPE